jgi:hypothetical protein
MNCTKDTFEIAYYIAFIILTAIIVVYAIRTYNFQTKKKHKLLCKFCIIDQRESDATNFGIEIYNCGNEAARDLKVTINKNMSFNTDYIKPDEAVVIPVGSFLVSSAGTGILYNRHVVKIQEDHPFIVSIEMPDSREEFKLNTDFLLYHFRGRDRMISLAKEIKEGTAH